MNIHEYQAKELLSKNGVNVPNGKVAFSIDEAVKCGADAVKYQTFHADEFVANNKLKYNSI